MPMLSSMTEAEKDDLGTRMLSKLIELYADQMGVTVEYVIERRGVGDGIHNGISGGVGGSQSSGVA